MCSDRTTHERLMLMNEPSSLELVRAVKKILPTMALH